MSSDDPTRSDDPMASGAPMSLDDLHDDLAAPPLGAELEAMLRDLAPVAPRRPLRDLALVTAAAAAVIALALVVAHVRRDLDLLPTAWLVAYGGAWIASFGALAYLMLVPRADSIIPRWLPASILAAVAAAGFIAAGLTLARSTPHSLVYTPTFLHHLRYGASCAAAGAAVGLVPLLLGARLLRGALPVGTRAAGAALGAACGAAGGFFLHLHCPITHAIHLGLGHASAILLSALLGALLVPVVSRP